MRFPAAARLLSRHRIELGLSLRMVVAGLASFVIGELLGLTQVYWAVLTAVVVMQASIGGSLKAIVDRFAGTLGGAAWGVAVAICIPHTGPVTTAIALTVALVPLAMLVAFRPAYRVAPVTAVIVLLGRFAQVGVIAAAFDRVFEIGLGSVVALAVAALVSPARAQRVLGSAAGEATGAMSDLVVMLLGDIAGKIDTAAVQALHARIRGALERATLAAGEAARERRSFVTDTPDPDPLVRSLRRLSHDLVSVSRALAEPLPEAAVSRLAAPAAELAAALSGYLAQSGAALAERSPAPAADRLAAAFDGYEAAMAEMRRDGLTRALSDNGVERVFGLSFGLDEIRRNLADLAARADELAAPR